MKAYHACHYISRREQSRDNLSDQVQRRLHHMVSKRKGGWDRLQPTAMPVLGNENVSKVYTIEKIMVIMVTQGRVPGS